MSTLKPFRQLALIALSSTLALAPLAAYGKHASFDLPTCDKLMDGSTPPAPSDNAAPAATTSDAAPATTTGKPANSTDGAKSAASEDKATATTDGGKHWWGGKKQLAPLKLTDDKDSFQVGKDGKMKVTVQQDVAADQQKGSESPTDKTVSVITGEKSEKGDISKKLLKEASKVNVEPLALVESDSEKAQKVETLGDAERQQLTDLWAATINRSPDIQFVINRLQPSSDPNHATNTALKMIGGALFSAMQAVPFMLGGATPGMNTGLMYSGMSGATSVLQNLLMGQDKKNAKKQEISQEQATILYKIVRETADKLVLEYRNYRKEKDDYSRAETDFEDLKKMVGDARLTSDAAKQIEMEYTLRKQQRELQKVGDETNLHRQALLDLAGNEAIEKLDSQIAMEKTMLDTLTGGAPGNTDLSTGPKTGRAFGNNNHGIQIAPLNGASPQ